MSNQLVPACVPTTTSTLVFLMGNQAKTTSLIVAEKFSKRHDHVLRAICQVPCDYIHELPRRSYPLFAAREILAEIFTKPIRSSDEH